jgi:aspartate/methionine/tyrosine aminotransferase
MSFLFLLLLLIKQYDFVTGVLGFRKHIAEYIQKRDGYRSFPGNIFLTNGASTAISMVLQGLLASNRDAVMIPIPQYPIYSALISKLGGRQVGYELDEGLNWAVSREELELKLEKAKSKGLEVKALAMINPGNPSGNVMTHCDIQTLTEFCNTHGIVLLADEVYQTNVYADNAEFVSAKKVAMDCSLKNLQLVSFHSTSKGLIGECGRRGGYMELHHIDPYVQSQLYKLASADLCSGVVGQIMTSLMVRPPKPGSESYELFHNETNAIFDGLKERSAKLVTGLNKIDGISCVPAEGAMYAFPTINVPPKAIEAAKEQGTTPDNLYALSLLEMTGICVVPASGFGQKKGRVGFRTTFLHPDTVRAVDLFAQHHEKFTKDYS